LASSLPPDLPGRLAADIPQHWQPLSDIVAGWHRASGPGLLLGLSGAQGSGKSTLAALLVHLLRTRHGLHAVAVSLDDFYLTRAERARLAQTVHPLFATRGPPGSHDLGLMQDTLHALRHGRREVAVPRFLKPIDDRAPLGDWPRVQAPVDVLVLEGWCLGAGPQADADLMRPLNALEAGEDPQCVWRRHVNQCLASDYQPVWNSLDRLLLLQAPSWPVICTWRAQAEARLPGGPAMTPPQLARFMQHYERTARHLLEAPPPADMAWHLDEARAIVATG
jgi:D-glycerate 3-kinase